MCVCVCFLVHEHIDHCCASGLVCVQFQNANKYSLLQRNNCSMIRNKQKRVVIPKSAVVDMGA